MSLSGPRKTTVEAKTLQEMFYLWNSEHLYIRIKIAFIPSYFSRSSGASNYIYGKGILNIDIVNFSFDVGYTDMQ